MMINRMRNSFCQGGRSISFKNFLKLTATNGPLFTQSNTTSGVALYSAPTFSRVVRTVPAGGSGSLFLNS
jgi:hypothetical protein